MKCVSVLSTDRTAATAIADAVERVQEQLEGVQADLAVVFCSNHPGDTLAQVGRALIEGSLARHVLGCTGESIAAGEREVENASALGLWAIELPGVRITPRRISADEGRVHGLWPVLPRDGRPPTLILLADPFSFPADPFLAQMRESAPSMRITGGMASASSVPKGNRLVLDGAVFEDGAVALELDGSARARTVVSQGCRPVGRTLIVTRAERNVIRELGRRPALEVLREIFEELPEDDQELVQNGLHIGRVINEYQDTFQRGDFLVRNVIGADDEGGIAVTDVIKVGQTVQFHVRDAASADEDLRTMLETERSRAGAGPVRGALLFTCNGRGTRLFDVPDHDLALIHEVFGPVPAAGFFAMGEIGPVGGQNFVHGFTAGILLLDEG